MENLIKRKEELFRPINQQIMMCDDQNDLVLLAVNMCEYSIKIFLENYTKQEIESIFNDMLGKFNKVS